ncbi:hypothetical protein M2271_001685 [Streptomyces sp. LBL]|uniref:helix-turn-helix domain-containing protein n=1 Tax=Streptomyces sp. LBL TaxID=2940562 RepID=UPI0024771175|nr:helix-turn-helix domain-containing protein [Streptomyces sp. LBL]MDH6623893.1 hypothetical protein [Streptomyces sp. LBL]
MLLSDDERAVLEWWTRRASSAQALALRARIVLACAGPEVPPIVAVARELWVAADTVRKWRRRFLAERLDGLVDEPRPGRPPTISVDQVAAVVFTTRANSWWGLPGLLSLNELPFGHPVDHRWCVPLDEGGVLSVFSPDGAYFVHDLRLEEPLGWRETAIAAGDRILSLSQAKQQARELEQTRQALAEHTDQALPAEAMVELLFRDEFHDHRGLVELLYVYWRLVAEVADACGAEAAWRDAARGRLPTRLARTPSPGLRPRVTGCSPNWPWRTWSTSPYTGRWTRTRRGCTASTSPRTVTTTAGSSPTTSWKSTCVVSAWLLSPHASPRWAGSTARTTSVASRRH